MIEKNPYLNNEKNDNFSAPLLPRSAWISQIAYLRALFRAKKALDLAEKGQIQDSI